MSGFALAHSTLGATFKEGQIVKMKGVFAIVASVGSLLCGVATAQAEELQFTYVSPNGLDFSFTQDSNPTPIKTTLDTATTTVSDWIGPYTGTDEILWSSSASGGMFTILRARLHLIVPLWIVTGPQVFSGTTQAPVFTPGVYDGEIVYTPTDYLPGVLTVTAVPEPASWAMLLVGLGGLGAAMRVARRRNGAASAAA